MVDDGDNIRLELVGTSTSRRESEAGLSIFDVPSAEPSPRTDGSVKSEGRSGAGTFEQSQSMAASRVMPYPSATAARSTCSSVKDAPINRS